MLKMSATGMNTSTFAIGLHSRFHSARYVASKLTRPQSVGLYHLVYHLATCVWDQSYDIDELRQHLLHVWHGLEQSLIDDTCVHGDVSFSLGSISTLFRWGGHFCHLCVKHFFLFITVQKLKKLIQIFQSCDHNCTATFLWFTVYMIRTNRKVVCAVSRQRQVGWRGGCNINVWVDDAVGWQSTKTVANVCRWQWKTSVAAGCHSSSWQETEMACVDISQKQTESEMSSCAVLVLQMYVCVCAVYVHVYMWFLKDSVFRFR